MKLRTGLSIISLLFAMSVSAEIPYKLRAGIEEVDYAKLNRIEGFKLPDSGQFRETTWVHGEGQVGLDAVASGDAVSAHSEGLAVGWVHPVHAVFGQDLDEVLGVVTDPLVRRTETNGIDHIVSRSPLKPCSVRPSTKYSNIAACKASVRFSACAFSRAMRTSASMPLCMSPARRSRLRTSL